MMLLSHDKRWLEVIIQSSFVSLIVKGGKHNESDSNAKGTGKLFEEPLS